MLSLSSLKSVVIKPSLSFELIAEFWGHDPDFRKSGHVPIFLCLQNLDAAAVTDDDPAVLDDMADGVEAELVDEKRIVGNVAQQHVHSFPDLEAADAFVSSQRIGGVGGYRVDRFLDAHLQKINAELQDEEH